MTRSPFVEDPELRYITKQIELTLEEVLAVMNEDTYEVFLDFISTKFCGNDLLMDIEMNEIQPMLIDVSGDVSQASQFDSFIEEYGEETIWDMHRDEPESWGE